MSNSFPLSRSFSLLQPARIRFAGGGADPHLWPSSGLARLVCAWLARRRLAVAYSASISTPSVSPALLRQPSPTFATPLAARRFNTSSRFAACLAIFPVRMAQSFLRGTSLAWARHSRYRGHLISAVVFCFVGAMVNMLILPGPTDAPIDQLFRAPGAAWVLFAFGITLAPFFEELVFRGFLLPALCTPTTGPRNSFRVRPHVPWMRTAIRSGPCPP